MENAMLILGHWEIFDSKFTIYGTAEKPLFLAKEVAERIGHTQAVRMIDSIDANEKVVNNVHTLGGMQSAWFLTENGLYEVLMQSRKPIAKKFKARVKEILRELRTKGKYEVAPVAIATPTVKYFAKMPVLTKMDLAKYFQCTRHDIHTALESARSGCIREKDYMVASGKVLSEFKKANPSVEKRCTSLVLIFKPGVNKLCQYFKKSFNNSTHQQTTLPIPTSKGAAPIPILPVRRVTQTRTDIPDNPKVQECIRRIQQQRSAMDELLRLYNRYNSPEGQKSLTYSLKSVATDLMASVLSMEDIPYNLVEKYV